MIFHHTGSKDTYITNKIVGGARRATTGNVGYASTIDLFKLYGENTLAGTKGFCSDPTKTTEAECIAAGGTWNTNLTELSRGLFFFDLDELKTELDSLVDTTSSSLKLTLLVKDIQGTQVAPANFTLRLWAVNQEWDEGIGDNVSTFADVAAANWLSRSLGNLWTANDGWIVSSWNAAADTDNDAAVARTYVATQTFDTGWEDLEMDITEWVKSYWLATNKSVTANYGFVLKFDTEETDAKSYFVKRFASRHTRNPFLRPKIVASWDNHYLDDRLDFEAGTANEVFLQNYVQDVPANFGSGTLTCTLSFGAFSASGTTSAVTLGGKAQAGLYKSTFSAISPTDSTLSPHLITSGSVLLQEEWKLDTQTVYTGSINLKRPLAESSQIPRDLRFSILDLKSRYDQSEVPVVRLFARERNLANEPVRIPIELQSQIVQKVYYQIRDTNSLVTLIPFSDKKETPDESTSLSADASGMFFSFPVSVLPRGRTYTIDIAFYDRGIRRVYESNTAFKVQ